METKSDHEDLLPSPAEGVVSVDSRRVFVDDGFRPKGPREQGGDVAHEAFQPLMHVIINDRPLLVGRSEAAGLRLLHPTISRRHATVFRRNGAIFVEDHESRCGTYVNGVRVRMAPLVAGDRIQFGPAITYRAGEQNLRFDVSPHGFQLSAEALDIGRDGKILLREIDLLITPDHFVGILGPSGSGKTTLLNCLASYILPQRGRLLFDSLSVPGHLEEYRAALGYVPQEDVLYRALTVRENLNDAARLRLGTDRTDREIRAEIERVLKQVGLEGHAEKRSAALSGGQRKRLSVAVELLKRPRLLLLDEPTSGLDPATESHLMEQLRAITRRGTTVVCTTHVMENLPLFDSLVILGLQQGVGRIAYRGTPEGLTPPSGRRNYAKLYQRLQQGRFESPLPPPRTSSSQQKTIVEPAATSAPSPLNPPPLVPVSDLTTTLKLLSKRILVELTDGEHWGQLQLLVQRQLLLLSRDLWLMALLVVQPLLLGTLVCLSQYSALHIDPLLFYLMIIALWLGLNNSARDLVRERRQFARDRLAGLESSLYLISKGCVHLLVGGLQLLILLGVVSILSRWTLNALQWTDLEKISGLWLFGLLGAVYFGALGLGLTVSSLARSEEAAVAWLPLLIMPQILISAIGAGVYDDVLYTKKEGLAFQPLVVKAQSSRSLSATGQFLDTLSLACFSRPALLLMKTPVNARNRAAGIWLIDLFHLLLLIAISWYLAFITFFWRERRTMQLIGVG